jgi:hypothetical protein
VTGGGEINVSNPAGFANFGFVAKADGSTSGQLEYQNHASNVNVHSVAITSVSITGNSATFSGTCTKNGVGCTFTVNVQDNGEPGHDVDLFTISVDSGPTEGGIITKGNIQIHNAVAQNLGDSSADCDSAVALAGCSPPTSNHSGRLAQLWNYVRSAFWLMTATAGNGPDRSPPGRT